MYEQLNEDIVGGLRCGEQRIWAHVLLSYLYDFENSTGDTLRAALIDFMESIEEGDLQLIAEMANIDLVYYLGLVSSSFDQREKNLQISLEKSKN